MAIAQEPGGGVGEAQEVPLQDTLAKSDLLYLPCGYSSV